VPRLHDVFQRFLVRALPPLCSLFVHITSTPGVPAVPDPPYASQVLDELPSRNFTSSWKGLARAISRLPRTLPYTQPRFTLGSPGRDSFREPSTSGTEPEVLDHKRPLPPVPCPQSMDSSSRWFPSTHCQPRLLSYSPLSKTRVGFEFSPHF